MKIAVVGSGIAGLSAAWRLSQAHQVSIFEKSARLGMDAHGLDLPNTQDETRIDVPLRVFFDGFYPKLTTLYRELGIEFEPINYSASFGFLNQPTYFRFDNYKIGRYTVPFLKGLRSTRRKTLRIGWDILRFFREIPRSLAAGLADDLTLADYLAQRKYSAAFAQGFLYPAFAGICTCSHGSIRAYPARVILEYLNSGILLSSVQRVTRGTQEVVQILAKDVQEMRLNTEVTAVVQTNNGVTIHTPGLASTYDHVVLATQANQSAQILDDSACNERDVLQSFRYEPSRVVVHTDRRLAPQGGEANWAPVNFLLADNASAPMATIWMNAIQTMHSDEPVFQTWNPIVEPDPDLVLGESAFERPIVNAKSMQGLRRLEELHQQPGRRVWFCGSYAAHGIPLLESATRSSFAVAERLGSETAARA